MGFITEKELIEVLEFQLGIPHISYFSIQSILRWYRLFQRSLRFVIYLLPIKKDGNQLVVAMNDPMDYMALDDLRLTTGFQISPVIATKDEIISALYKYYSMDETFEDMGVCIRK